MGSHEVPRLHEVPDTRRNGARRLWVIGLAVVLAACGGGGGGTLRFGEGGTTCAPTVLTNDASDQAALEEGRQCFVDEHDAGRAVVWDVLVPTVEGDPLVWRYDSDGATTIIITEDHSRDDFGSSGVTVRTCADVTLGGGAILPEGTDCTHGDGDGFADDSLPTG